MLHFYIYSSNRFIQVSYFPFIRSLAKVLFIFVFRIETAVFYTVPIIVMLILIPSIVYVEHFNFNVSLKQLDLTY